MLLPFFFTLPNWTIKRWTWWKTNCIFCRLFYMLWLETPCCLSGTPLPLMLVCLYDIFMNGFLNDGFRISDQMIILIFLFDGKYLWLSFKISLFIFTIIWNNTVYLCMKISLNVITIYAWKGIYIMRICMEWCNTIRLTKTETCTYSLCMEIRIYCEY